MANISRVGCVKHIIFTQYNAFCDTLETIHSFSIAAYPALRIAGGAGAHPGCLGAKAWYTLDELPV